MRNLVSAESRTEPSLMAAAAGFCLVMLVSVATLPAPAGAESTPAPSTPQLVKGEVVMLSSDVCVVKDATGRTVLFKVEAKTKFNGTVKEGAKVEVSASADGVALSIKAVN